MRSKAAKQISTKCINYPLSTRINLLRSSRQLLQKELAGYLKVSLRSVTSWEAGNIPSTASLQQLSDYFNIPLGVLIGTDEEFALFIAGLSDNSIPAAETFTVTLNRSDAAFWELYRTLPPGCRNLIQNMVQLIHKEKDSIEKEVTPPPHFLSRLP